MSYPAWGIGIFVVLGGGVALLLGLEHRFPLRCRKAGFVARFLVNIMLAAAAFVVGAFVVTPVALRLIDWSSEQPFGLLHLLPLGPAASIVAGFCLMDLSFYYWHLANHRVRFLWRFHNVHHIDPDLDVSTAFRFHVGEILLSTGFRALQVVVLGIPAVTYFLYELVFQLNTLFHHSNLRLPIRLERMLNKILVTPRMHGVHHSIIEREANSNYSVVFSWWDRLHRSIQLDIPQSEVVVGVPAYLQPEDNRIGSALLLPFRRQREYWLRPDGTRPVRERAAGRAKHCFMAE